MITATLIKVVLFSSFGLSVGCYKILCVYPTISPSHYFPTESLLIGLAAKGHNVTVITNIKTSSIKERLDNFNQIVIKSPDTQQEMVKGLMKEPASIFNLYQQIEPISKFIISKNEHLLDSFETREIMQKETFDLIILEATFGNSLIGLASHFKCSVILITTIKSQYGLHIMSGNPIALSYVTNHFHGFPEPLNFKYRVLNLFWYFIDNIYFEKPFYRKNKESYEKKFPTPKFPSYDDMIRNISLVFLCHHFSQGDVRPYVPGLVEIGGIQMKEKPTPLPPDLQKWMDESSHGVIYFSLGTNMKSADLPQTLLQELVNVFQSISLNVLWKFESELKMPVPKNVKLMKWLPQDDILQHKNMKLFITHGGLGGVMEAKYHGVPVIVTPLFGDQMSNAKTVVKQEWGISLPFVELNEVTLKRAINEILSNPKYEQRAKYESLLYRDRPMTALQTGVYWVEYVIRHRGAKHIQSNARYLNFFQLHSLDVIGFFMFIILAIAILSYKSVCILLANVPLKYLNKIKTQ